MRFRFKPIRSIALCAVAVLTTACPQDRPLKNGLTVDDHNQTTSISSDVQNFTAPTYQVDGGGTLPAVQEEDLKDFIVECFSNDVENTDAVEIMILPDGRFSIINKDENSDNPVSVNLKRFDGKEDFLGDIGSGSLNSYWAPDRAYRTLDAVLRMRNETIRINRADSGVYMIEDSIDGEPVLRMKIYPEANRVVGYSIGTITPKVTRALIDVDASLIPTTSFEEKPGNMISIAPRDAEGHGFFDQVLRVENVQANRTCAVSHTQEVFR